MSYYFDNKQIMSGPSIKQQDSHMIMTGVSKTVKERIISIDTKFRKDIVYGQNADAEFTVNFGEKITEVRSMSVDSIDIPITFFNINTSNNKFYINTSLITLTPGFYTNTTAVVTEMNSKMISAGFSAADISFSVVSLNQTSIFRTNTVTYDISFVSPLGNTTCSPQGSQSLGSTESNKTNLGWLLGFRKNSYRISSSKKTAVSECSIILKNPRHLFLAINEFSSTNVNSFLTPFENVNLNKNIIARISVPDYGFGTTIAASHGNGYLVSEVRKYLEKVNIQRMHIHLLDDAGNLVNLNGSDFAFCLRIVCE
jgi:hypothetical protein